MSSTIYGVLGIEDRDTTLETVGQSVVYGAINELLVRHNAELAAMTSPFIETMTTEHQQSYKTPGGGMMQEADELTRPDAVRVIGEYTVAYDLRDFRDKIEIDDIAMAYMTLNDIQSHITTVFTRHANTVRFQILKHLLNKTNDTFYDKVKGGGAGNLTIRRLANSDSTTYPPVIGSDTGADDNHYLASGYTAANISDTNNPFDTIREELEEHFDRGDVVAFIHPTHLSDIDNLTGFVERTKMHVVPGDDTAQVTGIMADVPGQLLGTADDILIMGWRRMPTNYILAVDRMQPGPLRKRIDRVAVAGRGELSLVADDEHFPISSSTWRDRHGYGCGNRLNGVAMQLTTDATYDTPTTYA